MSDGRPSTDDLLGVGADWLDDGQTVDDAMDELRGRVVTYVPAPSNLEWPDGDLAERRAIFVYEGARLQAAAVAAPVVPEPWSSRDQAFRAQFLTVIGMMCGPDRKGSPEELHDDWVRAYEVMGWAYGPVRDPEAKTHPDMVPFDQLDPREQIKDEVFVRLCEIARVSIHDEWEGQA